MIAHAQGWRTERQCIDSLHMEDEIELIDIVSTSPLLDPSRMAGIGGEGSGIAR